MELYDSFSDDSYIVLTQNFISLKRFFSVINVISLVPSYPISKTRLIRRVFTRNEQILQKEVFCPASDLSLKYIFIKVLLICS